MDTRTGSPTAPELVVGIDLGGTKILGLVVDPAAPREPIAEHQLDTPSGAESIERALVEVITRLTEASSERGRPAAVGVGVAGLVDLDGVLRFAPNLPGVFDFEVAARLGAATALPVAVDNDANCALRAEVRFGAAVGVRHAILVTLGTGIGGAVLVDGALQRGAFGLAGEPGHMRVDPHGPLCPCGRRGCWERFASGSGLQRLANEAIERGRLGTVVQGAGGDPDAVRGEDVTRAARVGDPDAVAVVEQLAWWTALGIANLVDLLDPELVVVGGGLAAEGELLLEPVRAAYSELVLGAAHRRTVRIEAARLGPPAGAVGAALLATDSCFGTGDDTN